MFQSNTIRPTKMDPYVIMEPIYPNKDIKSLQKIFGKTFNNCKQINILYAKQKEWIPKISRTKLIDCRKYYAI